MLRLTPEMGGTLRLSVSICGVGDGREQAGGAQGRNRTTDTVIFSHVLYQLSYLGAGPGRAAGNGKRGAL